MTPTEHVAVIYYDAGKAWMRIKAGSNYVWQREPKQDAQPVK